MSTSFSTNLAPVYDAVYGDVLFHQHTGLLDDSQYVTLTGDQTITGVKTLANDVYVLGTFYATSAVIIAAETIALSANYLTLNSNVTGTLSGEDAGIIVNRGAVSAAMLKWDGAEQKWYAGISGSLFEIANASILNNAVMLTGDQTINDHKTFTSVLSAANGITSPGLDGNLNNEFFGVNAFGHTSLTEQNTVVGAWAMMHNNDIIDPASLPSNGGLFVIIDPGNTDWVNELGASGAIAGTLFESWGPGTGTGQCQACGVTNNTVVGYNALSSTKGSRNNTAIGSESLSALIDGYNNIAIGVGAGANSQFGYNNIAIGNDAFRSSFDTDTDNIAIGHSSMQKLAGSSSNAIAIGPNAMKLGTGAGSYNVAIGTDAMLYASQGTDNIAIGRGAMKNTSTDPACVTNSNIAIGRETLQASLTGQFNVAVGQWALAANTGSNNIAIGNNAGSSHLGDNTLLIDSLSRGGWEPTQSLIYGVMDSNDYTQQYLRVNGQLQVNTTQAVSAFSADGTLSANSDMILPTQRAVRTYTQSLSSAVSGTVTSGVMWNSVYTTVGSNSASWQTVSAKLDYSTYSSASGGFFKLDQSSPQTVSGGKPTFTSGVNIGTMGTVASGCLLTVGANVSADVNAKVQINTTAIANKGLVIQRFSAAQTANLTEWQNSSGVVLASVDKNGIFTTIDRNVYAATGANETITQTMSLVEQTQAGITTTLWASPTQGDTLTIKNSSAGTNTVSGNVKTIDGNSSLTLVAGDSVTLAYNGTQWLIFSIGNTASLVEQWASTPATSGATGTKGQLSWDGTYLYTCVATNTWTRAAQERNW